MTEAGGKEGRRQGSRGREETEAGRSRGREEAEAGRDLGMLDGADAGGDGGVGVA